MFLNLAITWSVGDRVSGPLDSPITPAQGLFLRNLYIIRLLPDYKIQGLESGTDSMVSVISVATKTFLLGNNVRSPRVVECDESGPIG